jgi:FxsC-like protein
MANDWFFLSYAKLDLRADSSIAIRQLYADLDQEVRRKNNIKEGKAGFFDEYAIEQGDHWPDALAQALISCRVLVCVYSRAYFLSDYCGKEWAVFTSRLNPAPGKGRPILPVLLDPPSELLPLPKALEDIQYTDAQYPAIYRENGLRYLLNRRSVELQDAYRSLLDALVARVIQQATKKPAPRLASVPDMKSVRSAFVPSIGQSPAVHNSPATGGPRYADFVFVAAKRQEIQPLNRSVDNYGEEGEVDWKPYLPGFKLDQEVALIAQEVATKEGFRYNRFEVGGSLIQMLEEAQHRNQIVILVVDTWTLQLPRYRELMEKYDKINLWNSGAVVTWNLEDTDTVRYQTTLKKNVRMVFLNKASFRLPQFIDHSGPPEAFAKTLSVLLQKLRSQIIENSQVLREGKQEDGSTIPGIQGPGESA